jgi:UDP-galactopyranose mutase
MRELLVVGAGFSGAVLARELAEAGHAVRVIDARGHVGGNCHTERDPGTGVLVHAHGPHIFHTSNETVWRYVRRFGDWLPFVHRVKAHAGRGVYGLPINLHTLNQFFGRTLTPAEARAFLAGRAEAGIGEPANFEEQALRLIGRELYEAFFRGYTIKQWGCVPTELPASLLRRLPVRFDYNDSYHDGLYQAMPREGYTRVIGNILAHPAVRVDLDTPWEPDMRREAGHVFFTGPLDQFYGHAHGRLGYRTVYWREETHAGDYQGVAQFNYTQLEVPWTRVLEYKHFAPWESHAGTLIAREFSKETGPEDTPYYPKRLAADRVVLARYVDRARHEQGVSFLGRLGTYRYLDMHQVIAEALDFSRIWLAAMTSGEAAPVFSGPPP